MKRIVTTATIRLAATLANLAPGFNRLPGIEPGFFGRTTRASEPGAGTQRRIAREAAFRADQAKRLSGSAPQPMSRQVRRRLARKAAP